MALISVPTVGKNLPTRMRIVWHRGKTNINRLLGNGPPDTRPAHESARHIPYDIVEMIIAHIAHDLGALKACSLACHSWYTAAVPHLHHTLTLKDDIPRGTPRGALKPLVELHRLGLTRFIKALRVEQRWSWFEPQAFSPRDLHYFSSFANVKSLSINCLDISLFMPAIEPYFGHFSPTLRSIALYKPLCTARQLSHFLSLFPNLDDIKILQFSTFTPDMTIPDTKLIPFSAPRLRGRLVVFEFDLAGTWARLMAAGGGLRFHYMELYRVEGCAPVLFEACAETLETLRFYATDDSDSDGE